MQQPDRRGLRQRQELRAKETDQEKAARGHRQQGCRFAQRLYDRLLDPVLFLVQRIWSTNAQTLEQVG